MSALLHLATGAIVLLLALGIGGCAGGASQDSQLIARVGGQAISEGTLTHWMTVLKGGRAVSQSSAGQARDLRKQALALLISRQWLIGEAASQGISMTAPEVRQQLDRLESAEFPGGLAEQREFLKASGETISDFELQARAELASAKLRRMAVDGAPAVTQAQLATYYAQHRHDYLLPERREARFRNRKSRAEAEQIKREVKAGKSLTSPAQRRVGELFTGARVPPGNPWERAIDSAKPHVVSGPYHIQDDYWLYEVVKIIPARQRTLAEVADSIRAKLTRQRRQKALADLISAWTAQWTPKTDCRPGYVVQRCRQYRGAVVAEDPLAVQ